MERAIEVCIQEGRREGEAAKFLELIAKKLKKGKSHEVIAEELEENPEKIKKICEFMKHYDWEDDFGHLYEVLCEQGLW